jgi:hypothetical protein
VIEHCEIVVTPEGLMRECINPDLRAIRYERVPTAEQRAHALRAAADRAAIEAEGFTLAYERPL